MADKWQLVQEGVVLSVDGERLVAGHLQRLTSSKANVQMTVVGGVDRYVMPAGFIQSHLESEKLRQLHHEVVEKLEQALALFDADLAIEAEPFVAEALKVLKGPL